MFNYKIVTFGLCGNEYESLSYHALRPTVNKEIRNMFHDKKHHRI